MAGLAACACGRTTSVDSAKLVWDMDSACVCASSTLCSSTPQLPHCSDSPDIAAAVIWFMPTRFVSRVTSSHERFMYAGAGKWGRGNTMHKAGRCMVAWEFKAFRV